MLYWLYQQLSADGYVPFLNLLKYQTFRTGMALFTAQQTMPWRFAEHRIITPDGLYTGQNYSGVTFGATPYTF